MARAQQELDRDELEMATEGLERAGGDPQAQIKRLKAIHDAALKDIRPIASSAAADASATTSPGESLVARLRAWNALRDKRAQIAQAEQDAKDRVQRQTKRRATIAQRIQEAEHAREAAKRSAAGFAQRAAGLSEASKEEAWATVQTLKQFTDDQRRVTVTTIGRRIQDQEALSQVYAQWCALGDGNARAALHRLLWGLLSIAVVLLATFLAARLVDRLYEGVAREQLRAGTLRTVVKFAVQVVGALLILFIVIGVPGQATTILGLAGAGLTVAMKDFIVAFFGWFVLMSKNGIRVGDWVEIEGVGGEVAEIGLFHTVLLETGAWIDAGHPTGRRVSFVNSFAIEGHYFNFSSSGQWMWDQLRLLVPAGQDPYPVLDGVQKLVERETATNAKLAEQEWRSREASFACGSAASAFPDWTREDRAPRLQRFLAACEAFLQRHERLSSPMHEVMNETPRERVLPVIEPPTFGEEVANGGGGWLDHVPPAPRRDATNPPSLRSPPSPRRRPFAAWAVILALGVTVRLLTWNQVFTPQGRADRGSGLDRSARRAERRHGGACRGGRSDRPRCRHDRRRCASRSRDLRCRGGPWCSARPRFVAALCVRHRARTRGPSRDGRAAHRGDTAGIRARAPLGISRSARDASDGRRSGSRDFVLGVARERPVPLVVGASRGGMACSRSGRRGPSTYRGDARNCGVHGSLLPGVLHPRLRTTRRPHELPGHVHLRPFGRALRCGGGGRLPSRRPGKASARTPGPRGRGTRRCGDRMRGPSCSPRRRTAKPSGLCSPLGLGPESNQGHGDFQSGADVAKAAESRG
ncbi:MAG TPA: mechanosensitive ion channel domain-containing protein [Anaeromyxobacter sp.]